MYDEMEYYEAFISDIEARVANRTANTHHFNNLGVMYWEIGRVEDAIGAFAKSVSADPANAKAHKRLGMVLVHRGKLEQGIAEITESLRLDPQQPALREDLERLRRLTAD